MADSANTGLYFSLASRQDLKDYCLRKCGAPVIKINIDDMQLEDCVDDAMQWFQDYHVDATEKVYNKYQLTDTDVANKWIPIPDSVVGVSRIFPPTDGNSTLNMFDIRYQIRLNDLYDFTTTSVVNYWTTMTHLRLLDMLFNGEAPVRYNRHNNRLYIDMDWSDSATGAQLSGQFIIYEATQIVSPDTFLDVYNDRALKTLATALVKKQWGQNLKKFSGVALIGGVTMNGQQIYDEATREEQAAKDHIENAVQFPPEFFVG